MDEFAARMNIFDELLPALRKVFDYSNSSSLKRSAHKCEFGTTENDYLGSKITPKAISTESVTKKIL